MISPRITVSQRLTGQVLGFDIVTDEREEVVKMYINESMGLQINVVVSRNASQAAYSAEVPIPPSVTGTLRIAAGLLTSGIRASSCESKTLKPSSASSLAPLPSN